MNKMMTNMEATPPHIGKFQQLLRELFQFDCADLDFERDKQFVAENNLADGADVIYVNGDSFIPNAKALDPLFKSRMFAGVPS